MHTLRAAAVKIKLQFTWFLTIDVTSKLKSGQSMEINKTVF